MPDKLTPRQRLDSLIDTFTPDIRSAFYAAMQNVVDNAVISDMTLAIEAGDTAGAFRALGFSPAAMRPLTAAIERAFEQGGEATAATFPPLLGQTAPTRVHFNLPPPDGAPPVTVPPVPSGAPLTRATFRFDVRNTSAETWLRDHSSQLVQRLTDEARTNVQTVLTDGMEAGLNPRAVALDIVGRIDQATGKRTGGIIGLTNQQEGWVRNVQSDLESAGRGGGEHYFNRELRDKRYDSTVQKAIDDGKPLDKPTIDRLVSRYKDNALKYRGETIARTEALQSLNQAEYEATKQAVDAGNMPASAVTREWDSAGDNRVRPSHQAMDGQKVGLNEPFVTPDGEKLMHPGDTSLGADASEVVNCRCRVRTHIDWFAGAI